MRVLPSRRAMLSLVVLTGLLVLPGAASAKCKAGVHKFGSGQARTFCGKAAVTITVQGRAVTVKHGSCQRTKNYFTINIGTVVISGNPPNKPRYFGLTVGKTLFGGSPAGHDGTYQDDAAVSFVVKHKSYALSPNTVTLSSHRTKGSFSGTLSSGGSATGTFHCK